MARNKETAGARGAYAQLLPELLQLYPGLMRSHPTWRLGYRDVGHLAHGWYLRCHRGVEAILTLDRAGYAEEASPIRRSVIEHVLALKWLAVEGDTILDTVARAHARGATAIADAVSAAGWTSIDPAEIEHVVAGIDPHNRDPSNDHLIHFAQRLSQYGDEHTRPGYLAECARTHPSYESAVCYVELPSGSLLLESRDAQWQVPFSTTHILEALLALRQAFDPAPWRAELDRIVESYLAVTDEVRRQDGLPPVDWSTGKVSPGVSTE
ncbi:MAG TPA: DUF5677 domain-containing protein [Candidatus Saccharimonadales bacterium]|nr:DUF5677 domain-containing protein [Candidatus Saccharimonadales bacterium]